MNSTNDNPNTDEIKYSKIGTLFLNIKAHSFPYVIKTFIYIAIIIIIFYISENFSSKILSLLTYMASFCLDIYFINSEYIKNRKLEIYCVIHALIIWGGTIYILLVSLFSFFNNNFQTSEYFNICNSIVNIVAIYATITPAIEIFIHCDDRNNFNSKTEQNKEV